MTESIDHEHLHLADEMHVESFMELKQHQPRYLCPYGCNKLIASRTIDYHKNNGCGRRLNDSVTTHPELKKRFYCCGACFAEFVTRSEFHSHLRVDHDVHPEVHAMQFPDRASFDRFLRWLETEGGAHFRHKSGAKRRGRGKGIFLACNRSGYVSNDKTIQTVDRTGPFRLGFTCTAYVHATEHLDGHVTAEVCGDHYGHDARMRLPTVIKYIVAQKQIEGCSSIEIIGYLRTHFLSLASENIHAQRICFVDTDELKSIFTTNTKKWLKNGIPKELDIWEEELLDKVGIMWPPQQGNSTQVFHQRRKNPTTSEIAIAERWPRPRVFVAKTRREDGVLVPYDLGNIPENQATDQYVQEEEIDDQRYMEVDMEAYEDEYGPEEHHTNHQIIVEEEEEEVVVTQNYQSHQTIIKGNLISTEQIDVEVENEVVVTSGNTDRTTMIDSKIDSRTTCVEEHVVISSPNNEIVIVDGEGDDDMEHHHHHHHQIAHHHHEDADQPSTSSMLEQPYMDVKSDQIEQLLEEVDAFKHTIMKRADQLSSGNLNSLLIRFQTLHRSIMEKDHLQGNTSVTVFPNRSKFLYRPGKGLEKADQDYLNVRGGDVTLQPIEDDISDDEDLMTSANEVLAYNSTIWS